MWRLGAFVVVVAACKPSPPARLVLGEPPSEHYEAAPVSDVASRVFVSRHAGQWDVELDPVLGTARTIVGSGMPFDGDALAFVAAHADLFGTPELVVDGSVVDPTLTTIQLAQRYRGLPVLAGHLGLTVAAGKLVLAQGTLYPIRDLSTTPGVDRELAIAAVRAVLEAPLAGDRDDAMLAVRPERSPGTVAYRLIWQVTAWRGEEQAIVDVDAQTGEILGGYDAHRYDYPGKATNLVDQRTVGDEQVTLPASYLRLHSNRGTATTNGEGAFAFRGEAGPLMVRANLHGAFVDIKNLKGANAQFIGMMRPESNYALEWTESRSLPEERDVFRGVNTTNRFVATVYPDNAWINRPLLAYVNRPQTCNAYWNGTSINFFVAGNGCNNTGRIFDVIAHEWGHGLDQNLPGNAIDGGLGEFIGDEISFVQTRSHLLGPGFLVDGKAVRDLEDPAFHCYDPDKRGVHAKGQLLGAVVWDIFVDLEAIGFVGEPLKRLMLRPIAIAQTRAEWYRAMLAVDDTDGNLANGTPHECLIYKQFDAHSCGGTRWPGIPDRPPPGCN